MKTKFRPASLSALVALLTFVLPAMIQAQTGNRLNETFDGESIPDNWKTDTSTQSLVNSESTPASTLAGAGGALRHNTTSKAATNGIHYSQFAATTLAQGDTLTMNFNFQGTSTAWENNNTNFLTFGLLGSTAAEFSLAATFGYGMVTRMEENARSATAAPTAQVMNGAVRNSTGTTFAASGSTGTAFGLSGSVRQDLMSFSLAITRQADDALLLSTTFTNVTDNVSFSRTYLVTTDDLQNADNDPYTFDTVFIGFHRGGTSNSIFDIDNVTVTYTSAPVPEPATLALLLGLGGLAGAGLRSRVWRRGHR